MSFLKGPTATTDKNKKAHAIEIAEIEDFVNELVNKSNSYRLHLKKNIYEISNNLNLLMYY